jgi:hypothetical protein
MSFQISAHGRVRSTRSSSGNRLSVLATLISPLIAVCLAEYLHTQGTRRTTFAVPIENSDPGRQECQLPAPRLEASMTEGLPGGGDHDGRRQAFPPKSESDALAKKLIRQANGAKDDPASRFVMLRLAKDVAIRASDGPTAFQAIDSMAETFHADADMMKMAALSKFAATARKPEQHKVIAEKALQLAGEALDQDHFMVASQLGKLALAEAKKALDPELSAQAQEQIVEVAQRLKAKMPPL